MANPSAGAHSGSLGEFMGSDRLVADVCSLGIPDVVTSTSVASVFWLHSLHAGYSEGMSSPLPTDSSFDKPDLDPNRPLPIEWATYRTWLTKAWSGLLNSAPDESAVQHFLERNPCLVPATGGA